MSMRISVAVTAAAMLLVACGPKVKKVEVSERFVSMTQAGQEKVITVTALDEKGSPVDKPKLTFSSNNPELMTVNADGKLTALKTGDAVVTVASGEASTEVPVRIMIPATITLKPETLKVVLNDRAPIRAEVLDELKRPVPGAVPEWTVEGTDIASVTRGLVVGLKSGKTKVTASLGTLKADAEVEVMGAVHTLEAKDVALDMKDHKTGGVEVVAKDDQGSPLQMLFLFKSSDEKVVTVTGGGGLTAVGPGKATITVKGGDKEAKAEVVVH